MATAMMFYLLLRDIYGKGIWPAEMDGMASTRTSVQVAYRSSWLASRTNARYIWFGDCRAFVVVGLGHERGSSGIALLSLFVGPEGEAHVPRTLLLSKEDLLVEEGTLASFTYLISGEVRIHSQ